MGGYQEWDFDANEDDDDQHLSHAYELGEGTHTISLQDASSISVHVTNLVGGSSKQLERFTFHAYHTMAMNKEVTVSGLTSQDQMDALLKAATAHVAALLRHDQPNADHIKKRRVSNFVFDSKEANYVRLGYIPHRDPKSIFLKEGELDALFGLVADFLASKNEYERCSVPYKLNLLLHGVPGTGKTSIIKAIASHFELNIAVIPFSHDLTDDVLAKALVKAHTMGCRLIALEDIDCIFEQCRKPKDSGGAALTLSGLLNTMDGMLRGSTYGLIMVLTANVVDAIDESVLRAARMDFALEFTHANHFQTSACFHFYASAFGLTVHEEEWAAFWDAICCHQFSTALLQQFFFQARNKDKPFFLDTERFKRLTRTTGKEGILMTQAPHTKRLLYT